jgi:hypothetical protein
MEATNQNLDSVLKKLRKLQNLYEGAKKINSEGEANAAAAAIQRLLTQYNLSMDEIGTDEEKAKDTVLEEKVDGFTYKSIGGEWEFRLLYVLCKWNFCKCFQVGNTYKRLMIFGKKENIETVKWLRSMLAERFVSFSKIRFKEYKKTMEYAMKPISIDKYQRSYLMGCAAGLDAKLKEESDREKAKNAEFRAKVTALVVRNDAAVTEYIENKYKVKRGKARRKNFDSARFFGFIDGKNTEIHKQVSAGAKSQADGVKLLK